MIMPTIIADPGPDGWLDLFDQPVYTAPPAIPVPQPAVHLARRIALALLEALAGRRSATQFSAWLTPSSWRRLTSWARDGRQDPPRLASIRITADLSGRVDVVIRYETRQRSLVAVADLIQSGSEWRCNGLSVLWPGS